MSAPHELAEEFPGQVERIRTLRDSDLHFRKLTESYHDLNRAIARSEARIDVIDEAEETRLRRERVALKDEIARYLG